MVRLLFATPTLTLPHQGGGKIRTFQSTENVLVSHYVGISLCWYLIINDNISNLKRHQITLGLIYLQSYISPPLMGGVRGGWLNKNLS